MSSVNHKRSQNKQMYNQFKGNTVATFNQEDKRTALTSLKYLNRRFFVILPMPEPQSCIVWSSMKIGITNKTTSNRVNITFLKSKWKKNYMENKSEHQICTFFKHKYRQFNEICDLAFSKYYKFLTTLN